MIFRELGRLKPGRGPKEDNVLSDTEKTFHLCRERKEAGALWGWLRPYGGLAVTVGLGAGALGEWSSREGSQDGTVVDSNSY